MAVHTVSCFDGTKLISGIVPCTSVPDVGRHVICVEAAYTCLGVNVSFSETV
jgi:hypothetical protein